MRSPVRWRKTLRAGAAYGVAVALSLALTRAAFPEGTTQDVCFLVLIPVIEFGVDVVLGAVGGRR